MTWQDNKRTKELERDLQRKNAALTEAAALLVAPNIRVARTNDVCL